MKISMLIKDDVSGNTRTNIYIKNRLILSEVDPTVYAVLSAISQNLKGFDLQPLLVEQELAYTGEQYLGEEYAAV